ncbi:MAG: Uncharacterized protein Athens071426_533 [Parcubacteria group bacterium Athens0714_26]|nr:MAG: Uncharacterized protein Athens101426_36 [Parcubacteria group bacterium Athens1014_26]TSD02249.1 MAG: Uncharacterized protein Athens071426_533 [Parcubacteria group bacterium Athens0714_26]
MKYGELNLGQIEAIVNKLGGMEGVQQFLSGTLVVAKTTAFALLERVGIVNLSDIGKFVSREHFTIDNKEVKIAWIGDNFRNNFLSKVEEAQAKTTLCISKLKKSSLDALIMIELGSVTETTLANIWQMFKKQPNGESGKLLIDGHANIFYVCDAKGVFWAVRVYWDGDGWDVNALSVEDSDGWCGGNLVFSRNS